MSEFIESVKRISTFFDDQSKTSSGDWPVRFRAYRDQLNGVRDELVRLYGLTNALPPDLGNVYDLPAELLEELSIGKGDELENQLVTVINAYGGEASLDQILVGLFRKFKVTQKRRFIQNKLYRMPMVWNVDGRKGVYTTTEPEMTEPQPPANTVAIDVRDIDDEIPF